MVSPQQSQAWIWFYEYLDEQRSILMVRLDRLEETRVANAVEGSSVISVPTREDKHQHLRLSMPETGEPLIIVNIRSQFGYIAIQCTRLHAHSWSGDCVSHIVDNSPTRGASFSELTCRSPLSSEMNGYRLRDKELSFAVEMSTRGKRQASSRLHTWTQPPWSSWYASILCDFLAIIQSK